MRFAIAACASTTSGGDSDAASFGVEAARRSASVSKAAMRWSASLGTGAPDAGGEAPTADATLSDQALPTVGASPVQALRDRMAYREEIRNEILENQLDDRHDLGGNTLYRLKFDVTVIPQHDTGKHGVVRVRAKLPEALRLRAAVSPEMDAFVLESELRSALTKDVLPVFDRLYERWLSALRVSLKEEIAEKAQLMLRAARTDFSEVPEEARQGFEELQQSMLTKLSVRELKAGSKRKAAEIERDARTRCVQTGPKRASETATAAQVVRCVAHMLAQPPGVTEAPHSADTSLNGFLTGKVFERHLAEAWRQSLELARPDGTEVKDPRLALADIRVGPRGIEVSQRLDLYAYFKDEQVEREKRAEQVKKANPALIHFRQDGEEAQTLVVRAGFLQFVSRLVRQKQGLYVYAVTPKEAVQQVQEADEVRQSLSSALALGAGAPQAVSQAGLEELRALATTTTALRRHPLLVGFGSAGGSHTGAGAGTQGEDPEAEFGWLIGARLHSAPAAPPVFRHAPIQNALSAVLSVPSWLPELELEIGTFWLDPESGALEPTRLLAQASDPPSALPASATTYRVTLPESFREINMVLGLDELRGPQISQAMEPSYLMVGEPGSVIVPGQRLWRSTVVTLGAQTADRITVLPNMGGIIADFTKVVRPAGWDGKASSYAAPLAVWTSEGSALAPVRVHISTNPAANGDAGVLPGSKAPPP